MMHGLHLRQRRNPTRLLQVMAIGAIAGASACRDLPPAPDPVSPLTARVANFASISSPDDDQWNRFEVDVNVSIDGATSPLMPNSASRGTSYRVVKRRDAKGRWLTDIDLGEYRPRTSTKVPAAAPPPIGRIAGMSRSGAPQFFDANGRLVTPRHPTMIEPAATGAAHPRVQGRTNLRTFPAAASRPEFVPADTSHDWVAQYVVTPKAAARIRSTLERDANSIERARDRSRFVRSQKGWSSEIVVDDSTGAIVELRAVENGRLRAVTERDWARDKNGLLTLKSERVTRYPEHDGAPPMVITMTYRNIRLLEER